MSSNKNLPTIRSSAAECLTFVAANGQGGVEAGPDNQHKTHDPPIAQGRRHPLPVPQRGCHRGQRHQQQRQPV